MMFKKLWLLFFTFAKISALVVGGGLAMLSVIEETFVRRKKLITQEELLDVIALCQMVPGIIAANSAVSIGMKIAGIAGAVAALTGAVLPSFLVILLIAWFFPGLSPENPYWLGAFAGIRAGVTGLIAVTAWKTARRTAVGTVEVLAIAAVVAAALWGVSPGIIIMVSIIGGMFWFFCSCKRIGKRLSGGEK